MAVVGSVLGGIDFALIDDLPLGFICIRILVEHSKKARLVALMACRAVAALLDRDHERILIAVDPYFVDDLKIPRFLALAPELLARPREVACTTGRNGLFKRLAVHIG